ncbi:MAG: hypothetical protein U1F52_04695 [Burkholderiales bacterium]
MRFRQLWQWPALFIAFVGLAGSLAAGSSAAALPLVSGHAEGAVSPGSTPDIRIVEAVLAACEGIVSAPAAPASSATTARRAADRIDHAIAEILSGPPASASGTIDLLARLALVSDALRSPDKSVRSTAGAMLESWVAATRDRRARSGRWPARDHDIDG